MSDQNRRRWRQVVGLARKAQQEGKPTLPVDVDLILEAHEFMRGMAEDLIYAREAHHCPS